MSPGMWSNFSARRYRLVERKKLAAAADTADLKLYNYRTDPFEMKTNASEKPQVVASLRALLAAQPEALPPMK